MQKDEIKFFKIFGAFTAVITLVFLPVISLSGMASPFEALIVPSSPFLILLGSFLLFKPVTTNRVVLWMASAVIVSTVNLFINFQDLFSRERSEIEGAYRIYVYVLCALVVMNVLMRIALFAVRHKRQRA
jgi:hypothetical protein